MIYVLYNPLAGNSTCEEACKDVANIFESDELKYINLLEIDDLAGYIRGFDPEDMIVICGGDGTLNQLINSIDTSQLEQDIYYFPAGRRRGH